MKYIIRCEARNTPATMERILRTVRVRGFKLQQMQMASGCEQLQMELQLQGERSIDMLVSQLNKLLDVNRVTHMPSDALVLKSA